MKAFLIAIISTLMMALPASAKVIYSYDYGQWQLMAWSGLNQFCAVKTIYRDGSTISLRQDSSGYTLVLYDPAYEVPFYRQLVNITFDDNHFTNLSAVSYKDTPNQVFIHFGNDSSFLRWFQASNVMKIRNENIHFTAGLRGTSYLGNYLYDCVIKYRF